MEIIKKQNQTQSGPVSQVAWEALLTEEKCLYLKTKVCQYHKTVFEVYYMSIICLLNVYYNKPLKISESKKKKTTAKRWGRGRWKRKERLMTKEEIITT